MNIRKLLTRLVSLALIAVFLPTVAMADTWYLEDGSITVSATDSGQNVSQGGVTKEDSAPVIRNRDSSASTTNNVTIRADTGATANVTLEDTNIDTTGGAGPDGGPHGKPCRRTAAAEQSHRPAPDAGTMCAVLPAVCRHLPARRNAPHSGAGHEHPVGELLPKNMNAVFCPAAVCDAAARAGVCGGTRVLPLCPPQPQPGFLGRRGQGDAGL